MPLFLVDPGNAAAGGSVGGTLSREGEGVAKTCHVHRRLLIHVILSQLGPIAGAMARSLLERGPLTLKELQVAVRQDEEMARVAALRATNANLSGRASSASMLDIGSPLATNATLATHNADLLSDVAMKEVLTRLVLHRIVGHQPSSSTYEVQEGPALLLRLLFPLLLQCARQRYGDAARSLLIVYHQLGVVPLAAAVKVAQSRESGTTSEVMQYALSLLMQDGWLEMVGGVGHATAADATAATSATGPYQIRLSTALHFLLSDALDQMVSERYADGGLAMNIIRSLRQRRARNGGTAATAPSFHPQQMTLAELLQSVRVALPRRRGRDGTVLANVATRPATSDFSFEDPPPSSPLTTAPTPTTAAGLGAPSAYQQSAEAVEATLQVLCQPVMLRYAAGPFSSTTPTASPLLASTSSSSPAATAGGLPQTQSLVQQSAGGLYSFSYESAVAQLQQSVCERVVFSRYGVLGVRLLKLLSQHHFLEDRTLAEEAVATHGRTREVLHSLFRDGLVGQQEVPRSAAMTDRAPKSSVFLWGSDWDVNVMPSVQEMIAKSLYTALLKLVDAEAAAAAAMTAASVSADDQQRASDVATAGMLDLASLIGTSIPAMLHSLRSSTREEALRAERLRAVQRLLQCQRAVVGLQSCVMSLMRMMVLVDFY